MKGIATSGAWVALILMGCNPGETSGANSDGTSGNASAGSAQASGSSAAASSGHATASAGASNSSGGAASSAGTPEQGGGIPGAEASLSDDIGDSAGLPVCPLPNGASVVQSCGGAPDMCPCTVVCPDSGAAGVLGECSSGKCISTWCDGASAVSSTPSSEGGGSTNCATAGYLLCDDFEGAAPGAAGSKFTMDTKGGYVVETVTTQSHSGTHSIHVNSPGGSGLGYIVETATFTPAITDFWGRAYLRFMANGSGHEVFVAMDDSTSDSNGEQVRMFNDMGDGKIATNRRSDDQEKESSQAIPMGQWFCFEWHETPTELRIYFNGQDLTVADETWTEPKLADLRLGFERFDSGTGGDVWIDDVAVNSTQIGCN
jgi:hypothetical protein